MHSKCGCTIISALLQIHQLSSAWPLTPLIGLAAFNLCHTSLVNIQHKMAASGHQENYPVKHQFLYNLQLAKDTERYKSLPCCFTHRNNQDSLHTPHLCCTPRFLKNQHRKRIDLSQNAISCARLFFCRFDAAPCRYALETRNKDNVPQPGRLILPNSNNCDKGLCHS